ncbi:MAG TPA: ExeM/NucH family extracellular endonuclease [Candidatus Limnocylindrales bacterium]|nr:ExeM/NucH family extracellular endonuclease [Candidatus Limnocylindrales bacterium]
MTSHRSPGRSVVLGLIAALAVSLLPGSPVQPALAVSPDIVISEIYGGGGNTDATYTHDYVELYNRGASPASLAGNSIQYASATGTGFLGANDGQLTILPNVTIAPGQYYLVREASGGAVGLPLPVWDLTDPTPISMSASAGKVAYVTGATGLGCNGGSTPCDTDQLARIVDLVGYGTANFFEGAAAAPGLSNTTAAIRAGGGATDTDNNAADFVAGAPDPDASEDAAPSVTSTTPANGATGVSLNSNLSITFSEPVTVSATAVSISCASTGIHAVSITGGPLTFIVDPTVDFGANELCAVVVSASQVSDQDLNDPPDAMNSSRSFNFTTGAPLDPCTQPYTPIYSIQGSGPAAAITGAVTTAGVVVGDFDGPTSTGLQGFYLQDPSGDGDAATSDGIFVYTGNATVVAAGDVVRVTGFARERFDQTTINGSDSNSSATTQIVSCGTGASVDPVDVTLPVATTTSLESYEGMLVRFPQTLVISEYFRYDQFGEIVLALPLDGEDRPFTGTAIDEPGAAANARALANSLRRITLDDGLGVSNPPTLRHPNGDPFSLTNRFRGGDTVANTVGVLGFDFSVYRIEPTGPADYTSVNPRPDAPEAVGGTLRAAAMNTLNFFITPDYPSGDARDNKCGPANTLECRGADFIEPLEFSRQRDKLLAALAGLDGDIIGLNEIENSTGVEPLLDPTSGIVAGLNAMPGVGPYAAIDTGVIGTDAIRVGLIYRTDKVAPVGPFKILDSLVDPRFIDTRSRPVLAQTFEELATGARITVAVNHFKSKGSSCADIGDPDALDGQGNCNLTRKAAAQALVDWLATDPTGSGDRDYLILGDLNSYAQEDPVDAVRAGADDSPGTADDFTNLIAKYQGTYAHSYVFDGQAGYLDYALASPTLVGQVTGAADWHIDSDEPDVVDYDTSFKPPAQEALYEANAYRASDHDPVVVGLDLLGFGFDGFLSPVDNPPVVNTVKAGQAVPVKFTLSGDLGLEVLFGTPTATAYTCDTGVPTDEVESTTTSGGSGLSFDPATGIYTYTWKTDKAWSGECRTFTLTLDDGTYRSADFLFR